MKIKINLLPWIALLLLGYFTTNCFFYFCFGALLCFEIVFILGQYFKHKGY